jgi:hypothetical protein
MPAWPQSTTLFAAPHLPVDQVNEQFIYSFESLIWSKGRVREDGDRCKLQVLDFGRVRSK